MQFTKDGKGSLPTELKQNIYAFSGAKSYSQLEALNSLLYDQDGKLRPFNEYMVYARKINRQYNINWLQSEWQTARTAAQMAEKWERLQETKDLFPNLKFRTVGDDRVRDDHARLDGVIKPIDDAFWSRYYPPLDWRCRCDVVATAENITSHKEKDMPEVNFKGNVGIDQEIFTTKGSFFKLANSSTNARRNMELSKLNAPYESIFKRGSAKLRVNIFAHKVDLKQNIDTAKIIVDKLSRSVDVRPHIMAKNHPNPEYLINGKLADRKAVTGLNFRNALRKANNVQKCEVFVIDMIDNNNTISEVINALKSNFKYDTNYPLIKEVIIISKDRKTVKEYTREEIKKGE